MFGTLMHPSPDASQAARTATVCTAKRRHIPKYGCQACMQEIPSFETKPLVGTPEFISALQTEESAHA